MSLQTPKKVKLDVRSRKGKISPTKILVGRWRIWQSWQVVDHGDLLDLAAVLPGLKPCFVVMVPLRVHCDTIASRRFDRYGTQQKCVVFLGVSMPATLLLPPVQTHVGEMTSLLAASRVWFLSFEPEHICAFARSSQLETLEWIFVEVFVMKNRSVTYFQYQPSSRSVGTYYSPFLLNVRLKIAVLRSPVSLQG